MNKYLVVFAVFLICNVLVGCGNDNAKQEPVKQSAAEQAEDIQMAVITGDDVFVREGPSTEYRPITTLNKGDKVRVVDNYKNKHNNNLYMVIADNYKAKDLDTNTEIILHKGLAIEYLEGNNRGGAICKIQVNGKDKRVLLPTGFAVGTSDVVQHISADNWYNVQLTDGKTGWVYGEFIKFISTNNSAHNGGDIEGLAKLDELLESNTVYGIHLQEDYQQASKKFAAKGWKIVHQVAYNPGFFAKENEYGFKESILYSGGDEVVYYVESKNTDALDNYYNSIEKILTARLGAPKIISVGKYKILEYACGEKFMHICLWGKDMSVGMISKQNKEKREVFYAYLTPPAY